MKSATAAIDAGAKVGDRIEGFDLLRGICAIAVAIYHVLAWSNTAHLYTWGTYAVYIFFVLSGASMWVAYAPRFASGFSVIRFLGLRLLRLSPLYLLALAVGTALHFYRSGLDVQKIGLDYLNLFFLFGLGNPGTTSQVVGGWSLGIEFVFYLLFPIMLALLSGRFWWVVLTVAFTSQHVFICSVLGNGRDPLENWAAYTQFLSFVFYFVAGCVIGRGLSAGWLRSHWLGLPLMAGCIAVIASASEATAEATLSGPMGIGLSILAAVAVAASGAISFGALGSRISELFGRASYGVYILHPFMPAPVGKLAKAAQLGTTGTVVLAVLLSLILALLLDRWYERPVRRWVLSRESGPNQRSEVSRPT